MRAPDLDGLDQQIIDILRKDGRRANTEIARLLGVSETTIRNRIHRLMKGGVIRIAADVNMSRLNMLDVRIRMQCQVSQLDAAASRLASIPEVRFVTCVSGSYNLLVGVSVHSPDEVYDFLTRHVAGIPGIMGTEVEQMLRVFKRDYYYWDPPEQAPNANGREQRKTQ